MFFDWLKAMAKRAVIEGVQEAAEEMHAEGEVKAAVTLTLPGMATAGRVNRIASAKASGANGKTRRRRKVATSSDD